MDSLVGKTAVITGAASGMGRAFATRFAAAGMKVALADVEEPTLRQAVTELEAGGATAIGVVTDVSEGAAMDALAQRARDELGGAHVVCLNAGVGGPMVPLPHLTEHDWAWTLGVNLWGVIHGVRAFLPSLLEQDEGHLVMTASVAGLVGGVGGPYAVSKFGVVALAEAVYWHLQDTGSNVGVTVLCPGLVATRIMESERNRPERLIGTSSWEPTPDDELRLQVFKELIQAAKPPAEVADLVHDAVLENRFYLYTDDAFVPVIRARHRFVEEGRNPQRADLLGLLADEG
ncbi:MAG: SDR family NAD(P)-dependent oxidoreductase [Acidimicrobiales bacterium]|nr:SDR family NAD(P)-dependent oxidoreductase [Acidimicrobiales bacterium]